MNNGNTYISEFIAAETAGAEMKVNRVCNLDAEGEGTCTLVQEFDYNGVKATNTDVSSAFISFVPVTVDSGAFQIGRAHV